VADERSRYEIYDYGYHYNTIAIDFYRNADPMFSTDEFNQAKDEWTEGVAKKRENKLGDNVKETDIE
jgi:hypothetical protein